MFLNAGVTSIVSESPSTTVPVRIYAIVSILLALEPPGRKRSCEASQLVGTDL